jgi:hypothetical protein
VAACHGRLGCVVVTFHCPPSWPKALRVVAMGSPYYYPFFSLCKKCFRSFFKTLSHKIIFFFLLFFLSFTQLLFIFLLSLSLPASSVETKTKSLLLQCVNGKRKEQNFFMIFFLLIMSL